MHPADIKASLEKIGCPAAQVARDLRVSRSAVSRVISGRVASRRIAVHIAGLMRRPVGQLWPGRYENVIRKAA